MPVLDDILAKETAVEEQRLGQAAHAADWTQTFNGPGSTEALRAARNVTDMANQAIERKMALAARVDRNALDIYAGTKHLEEFERQAPLRERLIQAQIDSQGATARFQQEKQARTLQDTAGFLTHLSSDGAPQPGQPGYSQHVLRGMAKHPGFAGTAEGQEMLKTLGQESDLHERIKGLVEGGFEPTKARVGKAQGEHIDYEKQGGARGAEIPAAALTKLGELNAAKAHKEYFLGKEKEPKAIQTLKDEIAEYDAQIKGWHDTFKPGEEKPAATPAVKHLGKFNPQTGNFE